MYTCMITSIMYVRIKAREAYNVYGFWFEDVFTCLVMWPFVCSQLSLQAKALNPIVGWDDDPNDSLYAHFKWSGKLSSVLGSAGTRNSNLDIQGAHLDNQGIPRGKLDFPVEPQHRMDPIQNLDPGMMVPVIHPIGSLMEDNYRHGFA